MSLHIAIANIKKCPPKKFLFSLCLDAIMFLLVIGLVFGFAFWEKKILGPVAESGLPVSINDYASAAKVANDLKGLVSFLITFVIVAPLLLFFGFVSTQFELWKLWVNMKCKFWRWVAYQLLWLIGSFLILYYVIAPLTSATSLTFFYLWMVIAAIGISVWLYLTFCYNYELSCGHPKHTLTSAVKGFKKLWGSLAFIAAVFFGVRQLMSFLPSVVSIWFFPLFLLVWLSYSRWLLIKGMA